jgi:ABC-type uncharacterized transport system involved in gliding motility auxiliary subunit
MIDTNIIDANKPVYYVQQLKRKIFKRIPGKIRKNVQFINILLIILNIIILPLVSILISLTTIKNIN